MDDPIEAAREQYLSALNEYLAGAGETALHRAYQVGRDAMNSGLGLLDVVTIHNEALAWVVRSRAGCECAVVDRAGEFLAECLSPLEMAHRGFIEANESLRRVNESLAQACKELEAFSYSVSHDLRAPLRSIDGFSRALLEDYGERLDDEGRDYLRRIRDACARMSGLITSLLTLSQVSRAEIHPSVVDMTSLARDIASRLQEAEPTRRVEFRVSDGMTARGDEEMLRIALENLLGNAWKYTSLRIRARIEFGSTRIDGEQVFFVRDNGIGFDMKDSRRLFEPFQRLHSAAEFGGSGIGLATVERVIRRHGGRIWAEGVVGEGATFYFTLGT